MVLSTQVIEHVPDTGRYLRESWRLLRPGGALIVTTHGLIPEHGCPYDFYRWTADGLARAVADAGFVVEENYKLTLDKRAAIYFLNYVMVCLMVSTGWRGFVARVLRKIYRSFLIRIANWLGDHLNGSASLGTGRWSACTSTRFMSALRSGRASRAECRLQPDQPVSSLASSLDAMEVSQHLPTHCADPAKIDAVGPSLPVAEVNGDVLPAEGLIALQRRGQGHVLHVEVLRNSRKGARQDGGSQEPVRDVRVLEVDPAERRRDQAANG